MDAIRKQLDALMGANRNGDVHEVRRKYYDRDVCRLFLCGLCPHDLFQLTKMDLGPCPKIHSLELRRDYEEAKAKGRDNFDRELEDALERHILECDRKIARSLKRLEDDAAGAATAIVVSEVIKSPEAEELTKEINSKMKEAEKMELEGKTDERLRLQEEIEILRQKRADCQSLALLEAFNKDRLNNPLMVHHAGSVIAPGAHGTTLAASGTTIPPDPRTQQMITEKLKRAEELGEEGLVDEAQKLMEEVEALKRLNVRTDVIHSTQGINIQITDQKLRVCDICGAFLSIYDSDRRLADHLGGKLHLGYMQIREKLKQLHEARRAPRKSTVDEKTNGQDSVQDSHQDKIKDEEKSRSSRDRDRDRSSLKSNDLERSRDRDRYRDSDRYRDRDTSRSKDYSSRDFDRTRDHEYTRRRERDRDIDADARPKRSRSRSRERSHERDRHRDRDDRYRKRN